MTNREVARQQADDCREAAVDKHKRTHSGFSSVKDDNERIVEGIHWIAAEVRALRAVFEAEEGPADE